MDTFVRSRVYARRNLKKKTSKQLHNVECVPLLVITARSIQKHWYFDSCVVCCKNVLKMPMSPPKGHVVSLRNLSWTPDTCLLRPKGFKIMKRRYCYTVVNVVAYNEEVKLSAILVWSCNENTSDSEGTKSVIVLTSVCLKNVVLLKTMFGLQ